MSAADRMVVRTRDGSYRSVPRRVGLGMIARNFATAATAEQLGAPDDAVASEVVAQAAAADRAPVLTADSIEITVTAVQAMELGLRPTPVVEPPEPIVIGGTPEQVGAIKEALAPVLEAVDPVEACASEGTEGVPCTCDDIPTVYAVELPQEPRQTALRSVWVDYARSLGVEVTSEMTKNQIRDAAADAAQSLAKLPQPALPGGRLETPEDEPATEESVADANEDPGTR